MPGESCMLHGGSPGTYQAIRCPTEPVIPSHRLCGRELFTQNYYPYTQNRSDSARAIWCPNGPICHSWGGGDEHHTLW